MKNKKLVSLFLIICAAIFIPAGLIAQITTFSKIVSTSLDETVKDVVEDSLGNFYYVGYNTLPGQAKFKTNGFILKTDALGNVLDSVTIKRSEESIEYFNLFLDKQGNIDICGYSSDDLVTPHKNSKIELAKFSQELQMIDSNTISLPSNYGLQHLRTRRGINDDYLFVSYVWYASYFLINPLFARANSEFDSLHFHVLLESGFYGEDIKQLGENQYWVASSNGHLLVMDSLFVWIDGQSSGIPHDLSSSYGVEWDTDTSFYLVGEWGGGPDDDIGFYRQFHPLDTANNLFNTFGAFDTLDYPAQYSGLDFNNKDSVYIGGTINYGIWDYQEFSSWYFVLQTDSLLNIRWEQFYAPQSTYTVMTKLLATRDGGCLLIGDSYDYLNVDVQERDIYIVKINNQGLITGKPDNEFIEDREAIVFPNPGKKQIKIRIAAQYPNSIFELYDMAGNKVIIQNITGKWGEVNTSFLQEGTYIYRIFNDDGLFETGKWVKQ